MVPNDVHVGGKRPRTSRTNGWSSQRRRRLAMRRRESRHASVGRSRCCSHIR